MKNGIKAETYENNGGYYGRAVVYDKGRRIYTHQSGIRRISRGDALADANQSANDLNVTAFVPVIKLFLKWNN